MIRAAILLLPAILLHAATPATAAEEVSPPDISPADTWQPRQAGSVRIMNKIDSTVQTVTLKVGETTTYESLSLTLSGCFVRPSDLPDDAAAHVKIVDSRPDTPGFNGWMLKREPSLNMLQHPVYDVQLAACG